MSKRVDIRVSPATAQARGLVSREANIQMRGIDEPAEREEMDRKLSSRQRSFLSALGGKQLAQASDSTQQYDARRLQQSLPPSHPSMPPPSPRGPASGMDFQRPLVPEDTLHINDSTMSASALPSVSASSSLAGSAVGDSIIGAESRDESMETILDTPWTFESETHSFDTDVHISNTPLDGLNGNIPATYEISAGIDAMAIYEGGTGMLTNDGSNSDTLKLARNTDVSVDWHAQLLEVQKQVQFNRKDSYDFISS